MSDEYIPIPVEIAHAISFTHAKSIVIIAAWDAAHGLLHITTYGNTPEDKATAATGGEIVRVALGADPNQCCDFEDFRLQQAKKLLGALKLATALIDRSTYAANAEALYGVIHEAEKFLGTT